jgi:hypothetical protein
MSNHKTCTTAVRVFAIESGADGENAMAVAALTQ